MLTTLLAALGLVLAGLEIRDDLRRRLRRRRAQLGRLGLAPPALPPAPATPVPPYFFLEEIIVDFRTTHRLVHLDGLMAGCRDCDFRCQYLELRAAWRDPPARMRLCSPRRLPPPTSIPGDGIPRRG